MRSLLCIALAAAALSACSANDEAVPASGGLPEVHVTLSDGRTVVCIKSLGSDGAVGLSCDWGNAHA